MERTGSMRNENSGTERKIKGVMWDAAFLLGMPSYNYLSEVLYCRVGTSPKYIKAVVDFLEVDKEDIPYKDRRSNWESKKRDKRMR